MQFLKTVFVVALGLGSVWVAWQIAPARTSAMTGGVAYAQAAPEAAPPPAVSDAEAAEQLARINAELARDGELKEFKPQEPLPADEAIEMSSEL